MYCLWDGASYSSKVWLKATLVGKGITKNILIKKNDCICFLLFVIHFVLILGDCFRRVWVNLFLHSVHLLLNKDPRRQVWSCLSLIVAAVQSSAWIELKYDWIRNYVICIDINIWNIVPFIFIHFSKFIFHISDCIFLSIFDFSSWL